MFSSASVLTGALSVNLHATVSARVFVQRRAVWNRYHYGIKTEHVPPEAKLERHGGWRFNEEEKIALLEKLDSLECGEKGAWLRRKELCPAQLSSWCKTFDRMGREGFAPVDARFWEHDLATLVILDEEARDLALGAIADEIRERLQTPPSEYVEAEEAFAAARSRLEATRRK